MSQCSFCGEPVHQMNSKNCKFCNELVCDDHIQLESHDCIMVRYVHLIKKTTLRRRDDINSSLNISTGIFRGFCSCSFKTEKERIDIVGTQLEAHSKNCDKKHWIEESTKEFGA